MISNLSGPAGASQRKEERLFQAAVLVLAIIAGVGSWLAATALSRHDQVRGILPDRPRQLVDFSLVDRTGATVTQADLKGKVLAVNFLFTGCTLTCSAVSKTMSEIQQLTTNQPDVRLISLTVDPRTDTPANLAKWGMRYGADTNRWLLLSGRKAALHGLIGASFLNTNATADPFNSMPGNFDGTERIAVVDKHGNVRVFFDGLRADTPAAVAEQLAELEQEP